MNQSNQKPVTGNQEKEIESVFFLLSQHSEAAFATSEERGPFVSAVGFLFEKAKESEKLGSVFLLLSDLARHTKNAARDPRVSLLVVEKKEGAPIHERKRLSIQGRLARLADPKKIEALKASYLKVFPRAQIFFGLPDFRFYELAIEEIHWIGGFGQAATFR